tara:strand:- start:2189 stop:2581 length:393 start_codon:yes stop_codon:yes gene_type:complete
MQFVKETYKPKDVHIETVQHAFDQGTKVREYYENHMSGYFVRFGHDKTKLVKTNKYGKSASKILNEMTQMDLWGLCCIVRFAINEHNYVISESEKDFVQSIEKHLEINSHFVEVQKHRLMQLALDAMLKL